MIFIANALPLNGGSTFLIRLCKEFYMRKKKSVVLVLFKNYDLNILNELKEWAEVFFLEEFSYIPVKKLFKTQLGVFMPLSDKKIKSFFSIYGKTVHVFGVFGLIFCKRIKEELNITVGIYHQNEFMFVGGDYYFANKAKEIFSSISSENVVFYNDASKLAYEKFFGVDYSKSPLLPVGIDFNNKEYKIFGSSYSKRIISVGNLYDFKTYNKHIISCLPEILKKNPAVTYEIYGSGPEEDNLKILSKKLGVEKYVHFYGTVNYKHLNEIFKDAWIFVGSGTSIVEAAALGIPAIIGIESIETPETYGLLGDVKGFTYHEFIKDKPLKNFKEFIYYLDESKENWIFEAGKSIRKAEEFSVSNTADGFFCLYENNFKLKYCEYFNILALYSLCICFLKDYLGVDRSFSQRRNQGSF